MPPERGAYGTTHDIAILRLKPHARKALISMYFPGRGGFSLPVWATKVAPTLA